MISLTYYLILSAVLFSIGLFGVLTRRNILGILMSIELIFNSANINLIAFARFITPNRFDGDLFVIFVITVAACEAVVGLAIILSIYRNFGSIYSEKINLMKG